MTPAESYHYSYDSKEKKYIDLENDMEIVTGGETASFAPTMTIHAMGFWRLFAPCIFLSR